MGNVESNSRVLPYHLLGRLRRLTASVDDRAGEAAPTRSRWWCPFLELVLALVFLVALTSVATGAFFVLENVFHPSPSAFDEFEFANHPYLALVTFIGWVAALPAGFLAARIVGRDPRALWSVKGRFRWDYFTLALVPALFFLGAEGIYAIALSDWANATFKPVNFAALAVILALVPLQSLSEELFFRGSLVQITGRWFSSAWVAYILPLLFFLSGHHYGWQGMVSVAVFAVCASFLTHVTGGIEAAAAIHAVGNTFAYAPDAFGVNGVDLAIASSRDLAVSVVLTLATAVAVFVLVKRRNV